MGAERVKGIVDTCSLKHNDGLSSMFTGPASRFKSRLPMKVVHVKVDEVPSHFGCLGRVEGVS